ncbi:MAG TPA: RNA-binding protein [Draconibacterium sp.]|nr:RNA-binding protein [Draconibacterium sp.]
MNIYVSNLSFSTSSESLEQLFAGYGEITSAKVITDKYTGKSRGFGFVELADEDGQKAIDELNDTNFEGKTIVVKLARPRTERNDNGYGNSNRNRGGGSGYNRRSY